MHCCLNGGIIGISCVISIAYMANDVQMLYFCFSYRNGMSDTSSGDFFLGVAQPAVALPGFVVVVLTDVVIVHSSAKGTLVGGEFSW